jgi:hypothetical protein
VNDQIYVFIDNSFLFAEGYKHANKVARPPATKHPYIDYPGLKRFLQKQGDLKRDVVVGSNLPGSMMAKCQSLGFLVLSFPKYPDFKTGVLKEKGVDHRIVWEIAKTIFTNKDPLPNKKIIICTGDKDFISILPEIHTSNWALEIWLWTNSYSPKILEAVKPFGSVKVLDSEWSQFIKIGDKRTITTP